MRRHRTAPSTPPSAGFRSEQGRQRFLAAYDAAFAALWPGPREELDVETSYGTVHVHRVTAHSASHDGSEAAPFVLLHGSGANAVSWYRQITALSARHDVLAVDTIDDPGRSIVTRGGLTDDDQAAWIDELLAKLDLGRVHVVGTSWGGWLALNLAERRPHRLASVSLLDPGGLERVRPRFFVTVLGGVLALGLPRSLRPWAARALANHALVEPRELLAPVMLGSRVYRQQRSLARPLTDEELAGITVPAQFLLAERSTLLHAERAAARVRRLLPEARVEVVAGVGHGLPLEDPALVNERLLSFASAVETTGSVGPGHAL